MTQVQYEKYEFDLTKLKDQFILYEDGSLAKIIRIDWDPPKTEEIIKKGFLVKEKKVMKIIKGTVTIRMLESKHIGTDFHACQKFDENYQLATWLRVIKRRHNNYNTLVKELQTFGNLSTIFENIK